jgi:hypothetical protein
MPDMIEIALREFETIDSHMYQAMKSVSLAMMGCVEPPQLISRVFIYPAASSNQYCAILTVENANWVQNLMETATSADDIVRALITRFGEVNSFVANDVLQDLYKILTHQTLTDQPRAAGAYIGGGDVPLGCCTVGTAHYANLSQAQCNAYGSGATWNPGNPNCTGDAKGDGNVAAPPRRRVRR